MNQSGRQLPIPFPEGLLDFESMAESPANSHALNAIRDVDRWAQARLCLIGPKKSGVTSLLAAWSAERKGAFVDGKDDGGTAYIASEFGAGDSVAIDNADLITDESWILTLLSAADRHHGTVLLGAHRPPADWVIESPDLRSRLRSTQLVEIGPPDDGLMRARLRRATSRFGLSLPIAVEDYLVVRLGLSYTAIEETVNSLAGAAGGRQALTVHLARTALESSSSDFEEGK